LRGGRRVKLEQSRRRGHRGVDRRAPEGEAHCGRAAREERRGGWRRAASRGAGGGAPGCENGADRGGGADQRRHVRALRQLRGASGGCGRGGPSHRQGAAAAAAAITSGPDEKSERVNGSGAAAKRRCRRFCEQRRCGGGEAQRRHHRGWRRRQGRDRHRRGGRKTAAGTSAAATAVGRRRPRKGGTVRQVCGGPAPDPLTTYATTWVTAAAARAAANLPGACSSVTAVLCHSGRLAARRVSILSRDFAHKALKGELADQQLLRELKLAIVAQGDRTRTVAALVSGLSTGVGRPQRGSLRQTSRRLAAGRRPCRLLRPRHCGGREVPWWEQKRR